MPRQLIANSSAVATGHPLGASAGLEILQDGGNAIDAAVAATLALCVVIPGSVGLGGYGGSAVIRCCGRSPDRATPTTAGLTGGPKGDLRSELVRGRETRAQQGETRAQQGPTQTVAVDFDSRAPIAFREGLVTADPQSSYYGPRSVTVPAVVAGLDLILREFGTKSWSDVSQPAIRLAEEGLEFDAEHQRHLDRCGPNFDRQSLAALFADGATPKVADCWRQPDLARLLHQLADEGPAAFYEGQIAEAIVRFLRDRGGILCQEDFRSYRPAVVEALHTRLREFELYTPPPPSGGLTSLGIVKTVKQFLQAENIEPWGGPYFHVLAEASKLCWRERQQFLGDPDFVNVPMARLLSDQAAEERAAQIRTGQILGCSPHMNQSPHTSNVIAIDADGNLISLTATQGWMYGSHLVVDGLGLVLNHGMSRFDYSPGHPNAPAPGKRMQHNMAPMIALRNDRAAFAYGMPGGPKIVSVTAQLALNTIKFGATPAAAIDAPRIHTDGDEPLLVSTDMPTFVVTDLEKLGHAVRREEDMGGPVNVLALDPQTGKIDIASGESTGAVAGI